MTQLNHTQQPDFGTGHKKLTVYSFGFVSCMLLTLVSFWAVLSNQFNKPQILAIILGSALIQFIVQIVCFLRLNTQTPQGRTNIMSLLFTIVVLITFIAGSVWIMWSLNYDMIH
jgi:cytochrome o ubiquinol oxidase operon protein cyoD